MVYIIIGHPFAGKSTFTQKVFLSDNAEYKNDYYLNGNTIVLGNYNVNENATSELVKRHVGTDRISYQKGDLFKQIKEFVDEGYNVVAEGIRLTRGSTLKSLLNNDIETTLILLTCDTDTILERSKEYPVLKNKEMIDANKIRLQNLFNKYQDKMNGYSVNSNNLTEEDYIKYKELLNIE